MGLSERFKEKLETKDIFTKNISTAENILENSGIKFISKPIELDAKKISSLDREVKQVNNLGIEEKTDLQEEGQNSIDSSLLEDLETRIISKIRKIPYWSEYSIQRQEKMIQTYIDKKLQTEEITLNAQEKNEFIQNILTLANNR